MVAMAGARRAGWLRLTPSRDSFQLNIYLNLNQLLPYPQIPPLHPNPQRMPDHAHTGSTEGEGASIQCVNDAPHASKRIHGPSIT